MNVTSIMIRKVVTVEMDDPLWTIRDIFKYAAFHHIFVVDDRKLVGVISDRDLLRALSPFLATPSERACDTDTLNRKVHQIMSKGIITVNAEASIEAAAGLLLQNNISCLPVLSSQGVVEGIVTLKDILKFLLKE